MTIEEAIDYLENPFGKGSEVHQKAVAMAVSALRAEIEREKWRECETQFLAKTWSETPKEG